MSKCQISDHLFLFYITSKHTLTITQPKAMIINVISIIIQHFMRQTKLFVKISKQPPHNEVSLNAQSLIQAGFIDKLMSGVYTLLPYGLRTMKKIEEIIRQEIDQIGGQEILMPTLHPIENYKKTGRENIDVLFHTQLHNKSKLVLGQSHEEVVVPLMQKHIVSHKDLPVAVYQFQNKFHTS